MLRKVGAAVEDCIVLRGSFAKDQLLNSKLDNETYATLLRKIAESRSISEGRWLHKHIASSGLDATNTFVANLLIQMYGKCGSTEEALSCFARISHPNIFSYNLLLVSFSLNGFLGDAQKVFDSMPERDPVAWNSIISAYARSGHCRKALHLFRWMQLSGEKPCQATFVLVLDFLAGDVYLEAPVDSVIHLVAEAGLQDNIKVATALLKIYGRRTEIERAKLVFDRLKQRDLVSWTAMLAAYTQNRHLLEGEELFSKMPVVNLFAWNLLINSYGKAGNVDEAERIFKQIPAPDTVSVNSMLGAYLQAFRFEDAMLLFRIMDLDGIKPNRITFCTVLEACRHLKEGEDLHSCILDSEAHSEIEVGNALINMYGRLGAIEQAELVFRKHFPESNIITWTSLVTAYVHAGQLGTAARALRVMDLQGMELNGVTFASVLSTCSHAGLVEEGCEYFASMVRERGIEPNAQHYKCLIDLFGRAGRLGQVEEVLSLMPVKPDKVTWMTFLSSCKTHADAVGAAFCAGRVLEIDPELLAPALLVRDAYAQAPV